MKKNIKGERVFHSMMDVDKEFFPTFFRKKMKKKPADEYALGVSMAKDTIKKVRDELRMH